MDDLEDSAAAPQEMEYIRKRREYIGARVDGRFIAYLEERFGTGLPVFQRQEGGGFDPLDAMRRDAYREVVLWLQREREIYLKQQD